MAAKTHKIHKKVLTYKSNSVPQRCSKFTITSKKQKTHKNLIHCHKNAQNTQKGKLYFLVLFILRFLSCPLLWLSSCFTLCLLCLFVAILSFHLCAFLWPLLSPIKLPYGLRHVFHILITQRRIHRQHQQPFEKFFRVR